MTLARELGGIATTGSLLNQNDLQCTVPATIDAYVRIDALVNNTGHPAKGDLLSLSEENWQD